MIKPAYSLAEIQGIANFLTAKGTLVFTPLPNGLFPAAALGADRSYTGYSDVWVRDNVHVAHAHYRTGHTAIAVQNLQTLMTYFMMHQQRFLAIINGTADANVPMNRPHIRFQGDSLAEAPKPWAHAQNDALGYFLWMFCKLANDHALIPDPSQLEMLARFAAYFEAIRYWQDEDSGHWEETRKISASSIGTVVAGLLEFKTLLSSTGPVFVCQGQAVTMDTLDSLIVFGQTALLKILPAECIQPDPEKLRPYDSALLFLLYPLQLVAGPIAEQILTNVKTHLQGEFGIRRYLNDSYWAPDYREKVPAAQRTADFSDNLAGRNQLLAAEGQEAQWCIFDPIVSCIHGMRFKSSHAPVDLAAQAEYLNRSLGQITATGLIDLPAFRCPELYSLESEEYVPNDHVPLLWTQANLMLALKLMEETCAQ